MYRDFFEFNPTHKIVLLTNHKPRVKGNDLGIWRRLLLIPFTATFWDPSDNANAGPAYLKQDKQLGGKLEAEGEGILAWLVRGCLEWQKNGLQMPARVRAATQEYREDEDVVAQWIAECCLTGDRQYRRRFSELHANYASWCQRQGEEPLRPKSFGSILGDKGYQRYTSNGTWYQGITLREEEYSAPF